MKRILVDAIPPVGAVVCADEAERRHLQQVRRVSPGESLELLDGRGGLALAELVLADRKQLQVRVIRHLDETRESALKLALGLAIPSQLSTFDALLPGLVQLGVGRVHLAPTTWGGRIKKDRDRYLQRLHEIARQALKQCGRTVLPELVFEPDWQTLCRQLCEAHPLTLVFHPGEAGSDLPPHTADLGLLLGPEGGLTDEEVSEAEHAGALRQALGPRILRLETAALGACFWAQRVFGDLR